MTLIRNLFFLFAITLFAVASLVLDLFNYNPYEASSGVFANFFVSFFISLAGICAFVIYYTKIRFSKDKSINAFFLPSLRQGALVSLAFTVILILKTLKILDWWIGGPMIIAIVLLELFFQTVSPIKKKNKG